MKKGTISALGNVTVLPGRKLWCPTQKTWAPSLLKSIKLCVYICMYVSIYLISPWFLALKLQPWLVSSVVISFPDDLQSRCSTQSVSFTTQNACTSTFHNFGTTRFVLRCSSQKLEQILDPSPSFSLHQDLLQYIFKFSNPIFPCDCKLHCWQAEYHLSPSWTMTASAPAGHPASDFYF